MTVGGRGGGGGASNSCQQSKVLSRSRTFLVKQNPLPGEDAGLEEGLLLLSVLIQEVVEVGLHISTVSRLVRSTLVLLPAIVLFQGAQH